MKRSTLCQLMMVMPLCLVLFEASANMTMNPKRVLLENRERSSGLVVKNTTNAETRYEVTFKELMMNEQGVFERVDEEAEYPYAASQFIRFSPRAFTLKPGASQTIRLLVRKPGNLQPGEYRSHLTVSEVPAEFDDSDQNQVALIPVMSMSVPVIVRHGKLEGGASISGHQIQYEEDKTFLELTLDRVGALSSFGTIDVYQSDKKSLLIGRAKGISILPPLKRRVIRIPLDENLMNAAMAQSGLTVEFYGRDKENQQLTFVQYEVN